MELTEKESAFESLARLDEDIDKLTGEVNFDERNNEIVGLQREKAENMSDNAASGPKMTIKQKVERELAYVTDALDLDPL